MPQEGSTVYVWDGVDRVARPGSVERVTADGWIEVVLRTGERIACRVGEVHRCARACRVANKWEG